jgi:ParB family chromosome partitioning protein
VVAGARRLAALTVLLKAGKIRKDYDVPCQVLDAETDATEISLAKNVMRENMHPADQFEAFRDLVDKGLPAADMATRFGVTETIVRQRLRLGRVSPLVLKALRTSWPLPSPTITTHRSACSLNSRHTMART